MRRLNWVFLVLSACVVFTAVLTTACAGKKKTWEIIQDKQDQGKVHPAAWGSDSFYLNHRSPEPRDFEPWEFYFKHCSLTDRHPFPASDDYDCSGPDWTRD